MAGRPTYSDNDRARAYCACSRGGLGLIVGIFYHSYSYLFAFLSSFLWETAQYRLKYCLKGPLHPKTTTNSIRMGMSLSFPDIFMKRLRVRSVFVHPL